MSVSDLSGDFSYSNSEKLLNLMTRDGFVSGVEAFLSRDPDARGAIVYFDVQRFTLINGIFGISEGDRLLMYIAEKVKAAAEPCGLACRFGADRFALFAVGSKTQIEEKIGKMLSDISAFDLPFDIMCNAGVCLVKGAEMPVNSAIDNAIMAQKEAKGSFFRRINYYDDTLRTRLLNDQLIVGTMNEGIAKEEFVVYYQPQYNSSTNLLVGAEALVRWNHPIEGLLSPDRFIPIFERTGFIVALDQFVIENVCKFLRRQIDEGVTVVPISVNLSRNDIVLPDIADRIENIRRKYDIPVNFLHLEITESAVLGDTGKINDIIRSLHNYGYTVEMDDFGNGYSSLNVLKDLNFDLIKLDTRFFSADADNIDKSKVILGSVVRMVNWLQLPVIAEGVETTAQEEFLRSHGCYVIQGFLYAKPLPEDKFECVLRGSQTAAVNARSISVAEAEKFLTESLETLIFSEYAGAAALFDCNKSMDYSELLRINRKFLRELGMNLTEQDLVIGNMLELFEKGSLETYKTTLKKVLSTGQEQECDVWLRIHSDICGDERLCIRFTIHLVGISYDHDIFYATIRNITEERRRFDDIANAQRMFQAVSEQANIYYWEYDVSSHEMRPCYRCMRDMGFPAVVQNYPETAIEMGVFPPEVADEYREWMRRIDSGEAESLDGVFPLTVGRVPFHVRYTTIFDDSGRAVKAYGSAALVVDKQQ